MRTGFEAVDRKRIENALRAGEPPHCPVCSAPLARSTVAAPEEVAYVRRRILLVCPGCGRSAAFDRPRSD